MYLHSIGVLDITDMALYFVIEWKHRNKDIFMRNM